jgi:hypothetical protein
MPRSRDFVALALADHEVNLAHQKSGRFHGVVDLAGARERETARVVPDVLDRADRERC